MTAEKKGKRQEKRPHGADHMRPSFWWAMTGSNWFRSEHHLKEQSDAQMIVSRGCRRLNDRREKRKKARKKTSWSGSHEAFFLVGENRIELVPQRTHFEGAKRRTKCSESRMQGYMTVEKKGKRQEKSITARST